VGRGGWREEEREDNAETLRTRRSAEVRMAGSGSHFGLVFEFARTNRRMLNTEGGEAGTSFEAQGKQRAWRRFTAQVSGYE